MSGSNAGRAPQTNAQWVRDMERRVRALENAKNVRVGQFVLADQGDELVVLAPGRAPVSITVNTPIVGDGAVSYIQRLLTMTGSPSGGTWTLVYRGAVTAALSRNASANDILTALVALSVKYTVLDFDVTGSNGGPWTVTVPQGSLFADSSALTGGTDPAVVITTAT